MNKEMFYKINEYEEITNENIIYVEEKIGHKLPKAYIEFLKIVNGGILKSEYVEPNDEYVGNIEEIFGITKDENKGLIFWNESATRDYGYPSIGVPIGFDESYHRMFFLDYRFISDTVPPTVVVIDEENDYSITKCAETFEEFIEKIYNKESLDEKEVEKAEPTPVEDVSIQSNFDNGLAIAEALKYISILFIVIFSFLDIVFLIATKDINEDMPFIIGFSLILLVAIILRRVSDNLLEKKNNK